MAKSLIIIVVAALTAVSVWAQTAVQHDPACEKRLRDTQMMVTPIDPQIVCDDQPSLATQECMVELLTKLKGKLRNKDYLEIYGLCRVNSSQEIRDCMIAKMTVPFADKNYKSAQLAGNQCLASRKDLGKIPAGEKPVPKAVPPASKPALKKR